MTIKSKLKIISIIILIVFFNYLEVVNAKVFINEVLPNPLGDDKGAEWIELYNDANEPASLAGCTLHLHETDNNQKVIFKESDFVDKFKVISWDGSWLNNLGDAIRLVCNNSTDKVTYGKVEDAEVASPKEGISFGRSPDGEGKFYLLTSITLGETNALPLSVSSAPTQTEKTPSPTYSPTVTPSIVPKMTDKIISITPENFQDDNEESNILGVNKNNDGNKDEFKDIENNQVSKKSNPVIAFLFIFTGIIFLSFPFLRFLKQKKEYNEKYES